MGWSGKKVMQTIELLLQIILYIFVYSFRLNGLELFMDLINLVQDFVKPVSFFGMSFP